MTKQDQTDPTYEGKDNNTTPAAFYGYKVQGKELKVNSTGWKLDSTAVATAKDLKVAAGDEISSVYSVARTTGATYAAGTLTLVCADCISEDYTLTVTDPSGKALTKTFASTTPRAANITFSFGDGVTPALGEYTMALTYKTGEGTADEKTVTVGTEKITLVKVVYDLGAYKAVTGQEAVYADKIDYVGNAFTAAVSNQIYLGTTPTESFDYWTVDGVKYDAGKTKVPAGSANVVTVKAVYKAIKTVAAPTFTYANGTVSFANAAGDNYKTQYAYNGGTFADYSGAAVKMNAVAGGYGDYIQAKAVKKNTVVNTDPASSATTLVYGYNSTAGSTVTAPKADIEAWAGLALNTATSKTTAAAPQTYAKVLTTAKEDASKAIQAIGYSDKVTWTKEITAQEKAILDAIAKIEMGNLDAKRAMTKSTDGKKYTYVTDVNYAAAAKKISDAVAAFVENTDGDATYMTLAGVTTATVSTLAANDYAKAISDAVKDVVTTEVAAAVAEPAIAVDAQLAAAKTAAEAEAALAAYEALTAEQKKLVDAAGVIAAQEIVAAAELKDAQDEAAVAKTRNASKTVKAGKSGKTTKKQSVTLKAITSKSGAKVTYKKSSGSSKVTVKSGKAYLAKGVKKGTYKATVKATCGTQTAKIKVTFKVK